MTAIDATDFTLMIGDGETPETFQELGGLQRQSLRLENNASPHHGPAELDSWQKQIASSGQQRLTLELQGIFTDSESEEILRTAAFENRVLNCQIIMGNNDQITGGFTISQYQHRATMEGGISYQLNLRNAGSLTYVPS